MLGTVALLGSGCFERSLRPVNPCTRSNVGDIIQTNSVDEVDLLFMIDNSNSMREEQEALAREIPNLVRALATGDRDLNGVPDFSPVRSLHIGIVSSDMGSAGVPLNSCGTEFGDDGLLLTGPGNCTGSVGNGVFEFARDSSDTNAFIANVSCAAALGTGGCGIEQQLESVLKAISPSRPQPWTVDGYVPPVFGYENRGASGGHADGGNAGFVRDNSALAIIMITDEEDCSARNADVFLANDGQFSGLPLNLRCTNAIDPNTGAPFPQGDIVFPIERYIDGTDGHGGLFNLRRNPGLLIFAPIVGIPTSLGQTSPDVPINWDGILNSSDMVEMIDPREPRRLRYSCTYPGVSEAAPPNRIVRVAQGLEQLGASVTIQSICTDSYQPALNVIINKIADALGGTCLPRQLNPDAQGKVECEVLEVLSAELSGEPCQDGSTPDGTRDILGVRRTACKITQLTYDEASMNPDMRGWIYETTARPLPDSDIAGVCTDAQQRIKFQGGFTPLASSEIRLSCLQTVTPSDTSTDYGNLCSISATPPPGQAPTQACVRPLEAPDQSDVPVECDAAARQCNVPCIDADGFPNTALCVQAGLLGQVCDSRTWSEAVGDDTVREQIRDYFIRQGLADDYIDVTPHGFCVNPTCI